MSNCKISTINHQLLATFSLIRYRFFLFAGIIPYLLGQVIAFNVNGFLNWYYFGLGFLGIFLVLVGVELFNEYFDAKAGGDRIFLKEKSSIPHHFLPFALCSMLLAFIIGLYLTFQLGWPVLLFSLLGFLGAYFYVGPPIRWAYRGLGEIVIAFSYGPFMVLGSYYLQTKRIDMLPFIISLILGLLIFSLAIVNEIPDYFQDRLIGKRNLVVRWGRKKSVKLFCVTLLCAFILLGLGIVLKKIQSQAVFAFLLSPYVLKSIGTAQKYYDQPKYFLPAIRTTIFTYIIMVFFLAISYLGG